MSISLTVHSQASEEVDFERFCAKHESRARRLAEWIARNSRLGIDAADDIWVVAMHKLWRANWRPDAKKRYKFLSEAQDWALVERAIETALIDLLRREEEDEALVESLDAPIAWGDSTTTRSDFIAASDNVSDEVIATVMVEDALNQKLGKSKADGIKQTICHLIGECRLEDFENYDANYVRVTIHHLKNHVVRYLYIGDA